MIEDSLTFVYKNIEFKGIVRGTIIGTAIGYFIGWIILNPNGMMATYVDIPKWKLYLPWFCILIMAAIIVMLTLIGYLSVRQMLKGSASDALRPYTPKKMRTVINLSTYFMSILLTVGMSLLVSFMVARKNRKIDMVEALKGVE